MEGPGTQALSGKLLNLLDFGMRCVLPLPHGPEQKVNTVPVSENKSAEQPKWDGRTPRPLCGSNHKVDLRNNFQAASQAFHANRSIFTNHTVSIKHRFSFSNAVVSPVARFAVGHGGMFKRVQTISNKISRNLTWHSTKL